MWEGRREAWSVGIVIFKMVISKSVPGQKFWRKKSFSTREAWGKYKDILEIPWEKKYQVEFDSVFVVRFLAQLVAATLVVPGRKEQQVIRKWVFLHVVKAAMEGRKGRAGCMQKARGPGKSGSSPSVGQ